MSNRALVLVASRTLTQIRGIDGHLDVTPNSVPLRGSHGPKVSKPRDPEGHADHGRANLRGHGTGEQKIYSLAKEIIDHLRASHARVALSREFQVGGRGGEGGVQGPSLGERFPRVGASARGDSTDCTRAGGGRDQWGS